MGRRREEVKGKERRKKRIGGDGGGGKKSEGEGEREKEMRPFFLPEKQKPYLATICKFSVWSIEAPPNVHYCTLPRLRSRGRPRCTMQQ